MLVLRNIRTCCSIECSIPKNRCLFATVYIPNDSSYFANPNCYWRQQMCCTAVSSLLGIATNAFYTSPEMGRELRKNDCDSRALTIELAGLILNDSSNINSAWYNILICHWILEATEKSHTGWTTLRRRQHYHTGPCCMQLFSSRSLILFSQWFVMHF